ncbi:MAG: hypothetical protein JXR53_12775 [Bacteroidales bacterium]|nr:hypothetical protein [Bacteroidales bacterium]
MKIKIGVISPKGSPKKYSFADSEYMNFNTCWFQNTEPSINETHLSVPDGEDRSNLFVIMMFYLGEYAENLLAEQKDKLCAESIEALEWYLDSEKNGLHKGEEKSIDDSSEADMPF